MWSCVAVRILRQSKPFLWETHSNVKDIDPDAAHVLFSAYTLLGGPLEGGDTRILDFVQVLHALGDVNQQIGTSSIGTETPDLPGVGNIPSILVSHNPSTSLKIVTGTDFAALDGIGEVLLDGLGLEVQAIVLVLGLGQGNDRRLGLDGLTVTDDGIRDLERNTGMVFLEILGGNWLI